METMMEEERMQVKCNYDDELMHIQGVSGNTQMGREYGIAEKMRTTMEVSMWLREQPPVLKSAASGELLYTPFTIYRYANGVMQMFIPGTPANHPQGAMLGLHPLSEGVKRVLTFAKKAGFIQDTDTDPYVPEETLNLDVGLFIEGEEE
jgi:hypothetical protein